MAAPVVRDRKNFRSDARKKAGRGTKRKLVYSTVPGPARILNLMQKKSPDILDLLNQCGCSSVVEHHVANVRVVSSSLITRYLGSINAGVAQW